MWGLDLKLLVPTDHMSSQDIGESSQYVLSSRHISLKILSGRSTCIFLGIHVGPHLKPLEPINHMSLKILVHPLNMSYRDIIIGSVPQDLIVRLDNGHTCHSVQLNHSYYLTAEREIDNLVHLNNR